MTETAPEFLAQFFWIILTLMGISLTIALVGLALLARSMRDIRVPPNADFFTTLHYVPLTLVILLDLLDFGLDVLSAPISWIILDRMGLSALRNPAALEGLIPFTGALPTFTVAWFLARLLDLGSPHASYEAAPRPRRRRRRPPPLEDGPYADEPPRPRRRRRPPPTIIDAEPVEPEDRT
jgi:hypothetical protein